MDQGVAYPVPSDELQTLPEDLPAIPELVFTGPQEGWPPLPQERTDITQLSAQELPGSLTDAVEVQIRTAAAQDERVQRLLGDRFAYITSDLVELRKGGTIDPSAPLDTRVIFFSNSNNVAVEVLMHGLEVQEMTQSDIYQPPEGDTEIEEAIALAQSDSQLQAQVQGLSAHAILLPAYGEQPGTGHRLLWVVFTQPEESEAEQVSLFAAVVDLTEQRVLGAGPLPGAQ